MGSKFSTQSCLIFLHQAAEVSIRYFRGVKPNQANEEEPTPIEQVKVELQSIKSLISERANGSTVEMKDFCKQRR